jgi:hypothetical protein
VRDAALLRDEATQSGSVGEVAGLVSEQNQSGQFFAWKKRLREAETAKFVAVEVAPVAEAKWPASVVPSGAIEVQLGGGRSLVVEPGFDARHLRALLSVLGAEA